MIVNQMVDNAQNPLDILFSALSDPTRRAILAQLLEADQSVKQVAKPHSISMAMVSKHLHILERAGLIQQIKQGREKICRLEPDNLSAASQWLQGFGHFSNQGFDALETSLLELGLIDE
ncbi:MAG: metalloregulator ArsR/SmtB family transcription factor [Rhodobacteraceae bacterium]|nr:metalloregulator ArsR/SmtB family transcription factor [Paracoccaceae bacterium]